MNMHSPISRMASHQLAASLSQTVNWDDVIAAFEPHIPMVADKAREQQAAGGDAERFIAGILYVADRAHFADAIGRVLRPFQEQGAPLDCEEIERAVERLERGGEEASIIQSIMRSRRASTGQKAAA